jgi:hypothetical protein
MYNISFSSTHGSVPQEITVDHLVKHFDENQLFFTEWPNKCMPLLWHIHTENAPF